MAKQIPCFICGIGVTLHNETAIASLCEAHRTEENFEKLRNTPTHQLLRILNDGVKQDLEASNVDIANQIAELKNKILALEAQIKEQQTTEMTTTPEPIPGTVNEWGEVV